MCNIIINSYVTSLSRLMSKELIMMLHNFYLLKYSEFITQETQDSFKMERF